MTLLDQPIATAEFLVVDTETNGLGGRRLRADRGRRRARRRWRAARPLVLARALQPPARTRHPAVHRDHAGDARRRARARGGAAAARGAAAGPGAGRAQRAVRPARAAPGVRADRPRVARPAGPLHARRWRASCCRSRASAGWRRSPTRSGSRWRPRTARCADAETCARVLCALFPRLCANALTVGDALAIAAPAPPARTPARQAPRRRPLDAAPASSTSPICRETPASTCSATTPAACCTSASRSRSAAGLGRTSRRRAGRPAGPRRPTVVDYQSTNSELGALVLENRLIKQLRPPGNIRLTRARRAARATSAAGSTSRSRSSRSRSEPAAGHAVTIGPLRGRRLAHELVEQLDSLFGLRHCGRRLTLPRASVRLRADGALPVAVPGRPGSEPLPPAARRGAAAVRRRTAGRRASRLLAHVDGPDARGRRRSSSTSAPRWLRRRAAAGSA